MTLYSILFPNMSFVCEIMAGSVDKKKPTIGRRTNSRGNKNCLAFELAEFLGLFLKSITIKVNKEKRHEVNMKPAKRGKL